MSRDIHVAALSKARLDALDKLWAEMGRETVAPILKPMFQAARFPGLASTWNRIC